LTLLSRRVEGECEAFAMGQHARLGVESVVMQLEPGVVRMILELV